MIIEPEQIHQWYLDATRLLKPNSYNKDAQKPYEELTEDQKSIDEYIASQINTKILRYRYLNRTMKK